MTNVMHSDTVTEILPALLKAKMAFAPAVKGALNPAFKSKYVDLGGVLDAVESALLANEILPLQPTRISEGGITILVTRLFHTSGEWIGSEYPVKPVQATPQGEGSALTYARRYALMALVGIAPEDDDGNAGSERPAPRVPTVKQQLFGEIRTAAAARGIRSDAAIKEDFGNWSTGLDINDANETELKKYLDALKAA